MRRFTTPLACLLLSFCYSLFSATPITGNMLSDDIDISANKVLFDNKTGQVTASGDVVLVSGDITIKCDEATVNQGSGAFDAWGNVKITQKSDYWEGEKLTGNYKTQALQTSNFILKHGPIYFKTDKATHHPSVKFADTIEEKAVAGTTVIKNALMTSCDYITSGHPHYSLEASRIVIKADGYLVAHNVFFRVDDIPFPIFYLPVLWTKDSTGMDIKAAAGYRSAFGAFITLKKPMEINENVTTEWMVDFYTKRGFGLGNKTDINTTNTRTNIFVYGINDWDAPESNEIVSGIPAPVPPFPVQPVEIKNYNKRFDKVDKRYRVKLSHHADITETLAIDVKIDKLSDIDMLEDWFEQEYDNVYQPVTEASINFLNENIHLSLNYRPQINNFYNVVEKAPEFRADFLRTELGDSGIFYQADMTLSQMKMSWRQADRDRALGSDDLEDYDSLRFDTMHNIYMPVNYNNWLSIIPRAGIRATYYSDSSKKGVSIGELNSNFDVANPDNVTGEEEVSNYDDKGGDLWRFTGEVGVEMSFKKYKTWQNYSNESLRLEGLRHIIEPYVNITSIFDPNTEKENIYFFDEKDRVDELNFVRVGTRQRFQTRRNKKIYTFAEMENYADFHVTTRDNIKHLGDLATMIKLNPDEDLTVWTRLMIGMDGFDVNEFELGTTFGNLNTLQTSISYLYRGNYDAAPVYSMNSYLSDYGSNSYFERYYLRSHSVKLDLDFPINEKTRGRIGFLVDIEEQKLVKHYYEIQRDMHCWIGALRVGMDDDSFEAMVMFQLKAFPTMTLGGKTAQYVDKSEK